VQSDAPSIYGEIIRGNVYLDTNNNGIADPGEEPLANTKIVLDSHFGWSPYYFTTTDVDGNYSLGILTDPMDTLRPVILSNYVENISPPYYVADSGGDNRDFGIYLTPDITDASIYGRYSGRPRPGFDFGMYLKYWNVGTTDVNATVSLRLDPKLDFIEATPAPTQVLGDSLVWDIGQLPLFGQGGIWLKTNLPATATLGDWVKSTCYITSSQTDINLTDNVWSMCDTIVGSFDPNDKQVEPAEGLTAAEIAAGKELLYTIRFQNTGTYFAEKVRITDQLDTALNWSTFRLVAASHDITSLELRPGGLLEVVFDNIFLADSTSNEPASHGFVTYAIQRNKNFNPGRVVRNSAAIYFDFNEPIFTNELQTGVAPDPPVAVFDSPKFDEESLLVYPNPSNGAFTVQTNGKINGKGNLIILDAKGQLVKVQQVSEMGLPVSVSAGNLPTGVYFIQLTNGDKSIVGKVVLVGGKN
jgi:uncharacterized repeat protein (TIGR01451 family)